MKIKKYLSLTSLIIFASSCSNHEYSFSINDENKGDIYRNIDASFDSYESSLIYQSGDEVASRVKNNEDVLLFLHQKTCSHCQTLEPTFLSMQSKYSIAINAFIDRGMGEGINRLKASLDYGEELFSELATPSLYLLSKEKGTKIDLVGTYSNETKLVETIGNYINLTNVYISSSKLDYLSNGLYLLYKDNIPSFYYSFIKDKATSSSKNTYLYDVSSLTNEEINNKFGITFDSFSCIVKEKDNIKNSSTINEIEELATTYYGF